MNEKMRKLEMENEKLKESVKQVAKTETKTETIELIPFQMELIVDCFGKFGDCSVHYDHIRKLAVIEGPKENVTECLTRILTQLKKLKEELFALTPGMFSVLSREKGMKFLSEFCKDSLTGVNVMLQDRNLLVGAGDKSLLEAAMTKLKSILNVKETVEAASEIPTDKLYNLRHDLESSLLVSVSWSENCKKIHVEGLRDDVIQSQKNMKDLLEECAVWERQFHVTGAEAQLLHKHQAEKIMSLVNDVEVDDCQMTENEIKIKFKGNKLKVGQVFRNLGELKGKIISRTWSLDKQFPKREDCMLICANLHMKFMKEKLEIFEMREKCIILSNLPFSFNLKPVPMKGKKTKQSPSKRTAHSRRKPVSEDSELIFKVGNSCSLIVKPYGDITKEKSEVLVSVVGEAVDLRKTAVGQAFNRAYPSLWKALKEEQKANENAQVLVTKGPFKGSHCKAICHIILNSWNSASSPTQLTNAINLILNQAQSLGATSVSFPVLGCGRAFKFPPSEVARITLNAIKSSRACTSLSQVIFLAPDPELFKQMKAEAPKHFSPPSTTTASSPPVGATAAAHSDDESGSDDSDDDDDDDGVIMEYESVPADKSSKSPGQLTVTIYIMNGRGLDGVWTKFKKEVEENCLATEFFNQDLIKKWPSASRDRIVEEAKKLHVWVERSKHPRTGFVGFVIKGNTHNVLKIKHLIENEYKEISSNLPKNPIHATNARRGTLDFIKHAASSDEILPSYWKCLKSKGFFSKKWKHFIDSISGNEEKVLVDIDSETRQAIEKLIADCWVSRVGHGNDAAGLNHSSITVTDVKRVENPALFEKYNNKRKELFEKMVRLKSLPQDIDKIAGSKGKVATTECIHESMKRGVFYEVNEHYFFHGTKSDTLSTVINHGLDFRVGSEGAMFGRGVYAAESSTKADQYTDDRNARTPNGTTLSMLLMRVSLGNVFLCNDSHESVQSRDSKKLSRPPCMLCKKDKCRCKDQVLYDSVMGDGKWIFREFVVYESAQCYPEYVIYYKRV